MDIKPLMLIVGMVGITSVSVHLIKLNSPAINDLHLKNTSQQNSLITTDSRETPIEVSTNNQLVTADDSQSEIHVLGLALTSDVRKLDTESILVEEKMLSEYVEENQVVQRLNEDRYPKENIEDVKKIFAQLTKLRKENLERRVEEFTNKLNQYEKEKQTAERN